jgi:osmoprotectant transport system permease protein
MWDFWQLALDRREALWAQTGTHLQLVGAAIAMALIIGVPLGIFCHRIRLLRTPSLWVVGIVQTIPSLAMLALLLGLTGKTGFLPAWIALSLYALLPIVRNVVTGLDGVPDSAVEAARGVGMTPGQRLRKVELPLALPVIIAGVRTAAVISVGIATLAAFIRAGGLGVFIFRGISMDRPDLLLLGAIPAAALALMVDAAIWTGERSTRPIRQSASPLKRFLRPLALLGPVLLVALGLATSFVSLSPATAGPSVGTVRIGSKEFSEQLLLGELMAQVIEARTDLAVRRDFGMGGTMLCHGAIERGEIDLYAEYTGTGYLTILKMDGEIPDAQGVYETVDAEYRKRFNIDWLEPLGFANTYALAVREEDAEAHGWTTVSDLAADAADLKAGFPAEFMERTDGYPGLIKTYGFRFGDTGDISPDLMYEALDQGDVDVIAAFSTDGRLEAYGLRVLEDDRNFWPPYDAAVLVREDTLKAHPQLEAALKTLSGKLDVPTMQRLNYEVTGNKRNPADVAAEFLREEGLIVTSQ